MNIYIDTLPECLLVSTVSGVGYLSFSIKRNWKWTTSITRRHL